MQSKHSFIGFVRSGTNVALNIVVPTAAKSHKFFSGNRIMEEMVNRAVISIEDPFMDLELINCLLRVALDYNLCEVDVAVDDAGAHFALKFREHRSAVFIFEWVKFWMRPFGFDYKVRIVKPAAKQKPIRQEAMSVA